MLLQGCEAAWLIISHMGGHALGGLEKFHRVRGHAHIHQEVDVRLAERTVELFQATKRVAAHVRNDQPGRFTTLEEHRPKSHQKQVASWRRCFRFSKRHRKLYLYK